ncbi:ATP phosphoribosyltransferase regulatory subunit [Marinicrinis lubricantis]|uniref:ATP phosphoribosyltransferase regulatory subunit n=1 Tax=Marinicrinis lubricantis TaxID=2086470 RepID=A0ABW1IPK4_9BACL
MTKPKMFEKPSGVKDYLPEAVGKLKYIEANVLECMEKWGYRQILTPALEYYDTVGAASTTSDDKLFKLLDKKGTTMVLRSDLTAPIARVISSLLKDEPLPIRLSYHANVFRAMEEEAGREAEFFQTGVELVGDESPEADAEMVALAIDSLKAAGIHSFKIALGHVGFLKGLFQETLAGDESSQQELMEHLLARNYVGYRNKLSKLNISEQAKHELADILRLRGGEEACEQAKKLTNDPLAHRSIEHLCSIWNVLKDYDAQPYVMIDLTMVGDFSYYTGMTFEGYASDLGFPVCSGGRYDNLLNQFGRPAPATGFALKTNRILEVAETKQETPYTMLVLYAADRRREAFEYAREQREQNRYSVETGLVHQAAEWSGIETTVDGMRSYKGKTYQEIVVFQST